MDKYDNILAANGDVTIIPNYMLSKNQFLLKGPFEQRSNVICMTIEEAKEMWAMAKSGPDYPGVFELFLKSKSILI